MHCNAHAQQHSTPSEPLISFSMGKVSMMSALLAVLLATTSIASAHDAGVKIFNHVVGPLALHCRSGDTDLGARTLPDGQLFEWKFTDDFFDRTLYYCGFRWGARTQHVDVWTASIGCKYCVWSVTQDGFYRHEEGDMSGGTFVCAWK